MIRFFDGDREFDLSVTDLPIALGIAADNTLIAGSKAEADPCLWLRAHDGEYFLQAENGAKTAFQNGEIIKGSVWIAASDTIGLGDVLIRVDLNDDRLVLTVVSPTVKEDPHRAISKTLQTAPASTLPLQRSGERASRAKSQITKSKPYILATFAVLALGVAFVLSASPVSLVITPSPSKVSLSGAIPAVPFGDRFLALPGEYSVRGASQGYQPLNERVSIKFGNTHRFNFQMRKLPGLITVKTTPDISAEVRIGDNFSARTPLADVEIDPGTHSVKITSKRYLTVQTSIKVLGKGERQLLDIPLEPAWGTVRVSSNPTEADIMLNGQSVGTTPQVAKPLEGKYRLKIAKPGWKPAYREFDIFPGKVVDLGTIKLERVDGRLSISSRPSKATVTIGGVFRGRTPLQINLVSQKNYDIRLTKPGYTPKIISKTIKADKKTTIVADLKPEFGIVFLKTVPSGARLKIDRRSRGSATQRLRLQTRPHNIEITKPGYLTYRGKVFPRKAASKNIKINLERQVDALRKKSRKSLTTSSGHVVRIVPIDGEIEFKIGASRREAGRRSNETLYPVALTKSFVIVIA